MGLLDALIVTVCVGTSGAVKDACNKSLEAGTKQSGIARNVNVTEKRLTKKIEGTARDYIGNSSTNVLTGTLILAKAMIDQSATFRLPSFGICSSVNAQIGKEKSLLNLEWKF